VDLKNAQIMHCILCNKNPINATNLRTQAKSELISYFKTIGISSLKTCECISWSSCQNIWKGIHSLLRGKKGKATIKKRSNVFGNSISKFFVVNDL
jgi:hypothetical protein